jgi:hypothetical protein
MWGSGPHERPFGTGASFDGTGAGIRLQVGGRQYVFMQKQVKYRTSREDIPQRSRRR